VYYTNYVTNLMYLAPVVHQLLPPNSKLKEILYTYFIHMFHNNITSTKVAYFSKIYCIISEPESNWYYYHSFTCSPHYYWWFRNKVHYNSM